MRKQNNLISDTMKVIHSKFQPYKTKHSMFKLVEKNLIGKMPYPLTDNEDALDLISAKMFASDYQN